MLPSFTFKRQFLETQLCQNDCIGGSSVSSMVSNLVESESQWPRVVMKPLSAGYDWWHLFTEGTGIRTQRQVMSSQILCPSAHVANPFLYAPVLQSCTLPMTAWMDAVTWHFRSQILCWRRFKVALLRDQSGDPGYDTKGMAVIHARLKRLSVRFESLRSNLKFVVSLAWTCDV